MPGLFDSISIGSLHLSNCIMRSATAERLAHPETGAPLPKLADIYRALADGGVGLIVTGHAYVERSGKAHPEMASIVQDDLIPAWREAICPAQRAGARVMMQINHSGASCDPAVTPNPLSPFGIAANDLVNPREMTEDELLHIAAAFGRAARRAQEAGFDGVQIHGAHGYLISQFLMPSTNKRTDRWGGDMEKRLAFLRTVISEIRQQVGEEYPVWIKLGVAGSRQHGLNLPDSAQIAAECAQSGVDCVEISNALGVPEEISNKNEPPFLPMAEAVRQAVGPKYPLALVNGFRTLRVMQEVLASGVVQLISLCRPLIAEPDLPRKLREGITNHASCVRCSRCWPETQGEGIACHNATVSIA